MAPVDDTPECSMHPVLECFKVPHRIIMAHNEADYDVEFDVVILNTSGGSYGEGTGGSEENCAEAEQDVRAEQK